MVGGDGREGGDGLGDYLLVRGEEGGDDKDGVTGWTVARLWEWVLEKEKEKEQGGVGGWNGIGIGSLWVLRKGMGLFYRWVR